MPETPALDISDLSFRHPNGKVVFDGFSASFDKGRFITIRGASGIGKSTLLGLLAGHFRPERGTLTVAGHTVRRAGADRPVVFQQHNLFPWLTARENTEFGLKCRGTSRVSRRSRAEQLLDEMGVLDAADDYPHQLSGGMQQRVGIARALAVEPRCLLMDEPLSALDTDTRDRILARLATVISDSDVLVIMVTHHLQALANFADCDLQITSPSRSICERRYPAQVKQITLAGSAHDERPATGRQ